MMFNEDSFWNKNGWGGGRIFKKIGQNREFYNNKCQGRNGCFRSSNDNRGMDANPRSVSITNSSNNTDKRNKSRQNVADFEKKGNNEIRRNERVVKTLFGLNSEFSLEER